MSRKYVELGTVCVKESSDIRQKDLINFEGNYPIYGASGMIKKVDFAHQTKPYIAIVKDGAGIGRAMLLPSYSSVIGTMQYILPKDNVDVQYLFYAIQHMNLAKYFSGATIPHIYFKDYQKEILPLPDMEEQKEKAKVLSRVDNLLGGCRKQIKLYDELVKSRFIEVFGNPVKNTKNWKKGTVANITEEIISGQCLNGEARKKFSGEKAVLKVSAVTYGYFKDDEYKVLKNQEQIKKNVYPQKGDLLFSRANTKEYVGATALVLKDYPDLLLPDKLWKLVLKDSVNPVFIKNFLSMSEVRDILSGVATGTSGSMYNISMEKLRELDVIIPPLELQNQFAAFVHQTDKSKLAVKQSLEKLETLKKALMQQYFGQEQ